MRKLLFVLLFFPILFFPQTKDYKNFDKAVKYNAEGNMEQAIKYANKALENTPDWRQPNLLLAAIYANNNQIELAADYLLKVVASSIEDYDNFQQKLIGELEFAKMSSSISLQEMKVSHVLPLSQCAVN